MPRDYRNAPPTAIRREERAVTDEAWMRDFLRRAAVGTLATLHDGQPFINTNLFVYDEPNHSIILHTARKGRTRANIEADSRVCFSVMTMGRLLPAAEALEFSVEYGGVTIFGTAEVLQDEAEATRALQLLLDKYAPHLAAGRDYRPPVPEELKRTSVFRMRIEAMSAKKKEVEAFEGAYWHDEQPMLQSQRARVTWQGSLRDIFIAPQEGAAMQTMAEIEVVQGKGLRGDRYFDVPGDDECNEVTLIALEAIEAVNRETAMALKPEDTRRNLLTVGVPLNHLAGMRFRIGEVVLEGALLCEPCNSLARSSGYGKPLITALLHRAGLRATIVQGGLIRVGDNIQPVAEPERLEA